MVTDRVVGAKRVCLIVYLITQEANKLFFIVIVVWDQGAITATDASILLLLRSELYLGYEAVPPVIGVLDPCDIVVVVEDPSVALAALSTMLLKM